MYIDLAEDELPVGCFTLAESLLFGFGKRLVSYNRYVYYIYIYNYLLIMNGYDMLMITMILI